MASTAEKIVEPVWPGAITDSFTTEVIRKGTYGRGNRGGKYQFVKNAEASTAFAAKDLVRMKEATGDGEGDYVLGVTGDGRSAGPFGMAIAAIAAASFGTIIVKGRTTAQFDVSGGSGGNAAAGSPLCASEDEALHVSVVGTATDAEMQVAIATAQEALTADADIEIELLGLGHA